MKYVFLVLFLVTSVVHLYDSWMDHAERRKRTKPYLLLFLILFYIYSTEKIHALLLIALVMSWLGDILLIPKGHKWFAFGGISFMFSHLFFVAAYLQTIHFSRANWFIVVPLGILYFGISILVIRICKPSTPKSMVLPMCFYLFCNSTMNLFALLQLMSYHNRGSIMTLIGAILFFISDCTLFLVRYSGYSSVVPKKHFTVMLTYLLGEFLITAGMIQLLP